MHLDNLVHSRQINADAAVRTSDVTFEGSTTAEGGDWNTVGVCEFYHTRNVVR